MTSVLSDQQRAALLANAREMDQRAEEIRSSVTWSEEHKHSKSVAEVIEILSNPSTAELFVDRAQELLIESTFNEIERCVWEFVNGLVTRHDVVDDINSDHVYSVVRRAIRKATKGWED